MVKHLITFVSMLIFLFLLTNRNLLSQPTISVEFPSHGATNISLLPQIKIMVNSPYKIDESCLNLSDTIPNNNWDSVNNRHIISEMKVFPTEYYEGNDSTLQIALMFATFTKNALLDDSTFQILPFWQLGYETEYGIYIDDIRVYDPQTSDTLTFDTLLVPQFTTTLPMYRVENISSNGNVIRTGDTVFIYFNRELLSDTTSLGPLLGLREVIETVINDSTIYEYNDIPYSTWLNPDSKSISILPDSNFIQGKEYLLDVHLYRLTGDSADFYNYLIKIKETAIINITSRCVDSTDTLPEHCGPLCGNKMFFIRANEEFTIEAPKYYGDFFFLGWLCDKIDTINGNRNPKLIINFEPKDLMDMNITAYFARIVKDEIIISSNSTSTFTVFTPGEKLNDSVYTLPRKDGNWMYIRANVDSGYAFSHWESTDSSINGNTNANLIIRAYTDTTTFVANKNNQFNQIQTDPTFPPDWGEALNMRSIIIGHAYMDNPCTGQNPAFCFKIELLDGTPIYNKGSVEGNPSLENLLESVKVDNFEFKGTTGFIKSSTLAEGCKSFYGTNLPITKTMLVQLNSGYTDQYEIAYIEDIDGRFGIKEGRNRADYDPDNDKGDDGKQDPYGDSVGVGYSKQITLSDQHSCSILLHVVIFRKRCFLSTELEMNDGSKLPYSKIVNLEYLDHDYKLLGLAKLPNEEKNPIESFNNEGKKINVKFIFEIPKGDEAILNPKIITPPTNGYLYYMWWDEDGYTGSLTQSLIISNISTNYKTKYLFDCKFKLDELGYLKVDGTNDEWTIYDPDDGYPNFELPPNDVMKYAAMTEPSIRPNGAHMDESYTYKTTKVKLVFNKPLKTESIQNGISCGFSAEDERFLCTIGNATEIRLDGNDKAKYYFDNNENGNGYYSQDYKTCYLKLIDKRQGKNNLSVTHMIRVKLSISSGIMSSQNDEYISNPPSGMSPTFFTEFPSFNVEFHSLEIPECNEFDEELGNSDNYEMFFFSAASFYENNSNQITLFSNKFPIQGILDYIPGTLLSDLGEIINIPRISNNSVIKLGTVIFDKDGCKTDQHFSSVMDVVLDQIKSFYNTESENFNIGTLIENESRKFISDPDPNSNESSYDDIFEVSHEYKFNNISYPLLKTFLQNQAFYFDIPNNMVLKDELGHILLNHYLYIPIYYNFIDRNAKLILKITIK